MAEKAQAEPTMEEILASIRKIISDEGEGTTPAQRPVTKQAEPEFVAEEEFEDLSLDDVIEHSGGEPEALAEPADTFETETSTDDLLGDIDETMFEDLSEPQAAPAEAAAEEVDDFDLDVSGFEEPAVSEEVEEIALAGGDDDWDEDWDQDIPATDTVEPAAAPIQEEPAMLRGKIESTAAAEVESGLTDERIAGAAASALGKLMVKQSQEAGTENPNTLEGLMKELLRPMIKEWLDANLPSIVERKVEEEVQRIARMAR